MQAGHPTRHPHPDRQDHRQDSRCLSVRGDRLQTTDGGYSAKELASLKQPDTIRFHINSVGGTFAEGLAIANLIKRQSADTVSIVEGYALSMASLLMLAADRVEAAGNSLLMIHRAQGLTFGDVTEHEHAIRTLHKHDQVLIDTYRPRLGLTDDQVLDLLTEETWYTADEALAAGLVDALTDDAKLDLDKARSGSDDVGNVLARFRHPPRSIQPRLSAGLYS
ncbi:MAG: Clp protease ClpP [Thiolinea sp.]